MLVDSLEHGGEEGKEANVLVGRLSGFEKIVPIQFRRARDYLHRPVAMLAGTVDSSERLLMQ